MAQARLRLEAQFRCGICRPVGGVSAGALARDVRCRFRRLNFRGCSERWNPQVGKSRQIEANKTFSLREDA